MPISLTTRDLQMMRLAYQQWRHCCEHAQDFSDEEISERAALLLTLLPALLAHIDAQAAEIAMLRQPASHE